MKENRQGCLSRSKEKGFQNFFVSFENRLSVSKRFFDTLKRLLQNVLQQALFLSADG